MDTFVLQRMVFDGAEMTEEPPTSEQTGHTTRDPKDPEYVPREAQYIDLCVGIEEWWV